MRSSRQGPDEEHSNPKRASSAGVPPATFIPQRDNISIRNRGHLPHWEAKGAVYFVTFRLADSLPHKALQKIEFDRNDIPATAAQMGRELSESERKRFMKLHASKVDKYLDAGAGNCHLRDPVLA